MGSFALMLLLLCLVPQAVALTLLLKTCLVQMLAWLSPAVPAMPAVSPGAWPGVQLCPGAAFHLVDLPAGKARAAAAGGLLAESLAHVQTT
jgi:hypothetical protein